MVALEFNRFGVVPKGRKGRVTSKSFGIIGGEIVKPPDALNRRYFRDNDAHTVCGWKGTASYYDVVVDEEVNEKAAWYYPEPKPEAAQIKGFVAFWKGVQVVE